MIQWKRIQYQRTKILDLFTPDWTRRMVEHLHRSNDQPMHGLLSVLWAGDTMVAAHFGMIDRGLLHYWFPTYNVAHSRYSPGAALFKSIIRDATDNGLNCIDMGYGEQPYKRKQTDTITTVHHGTISNCPIHRRWCRIRLAMDGLAKRMPMKESLKRILRAVQPNAGIGKLG
jgi:CelD/BcsL family acetyltransferase involved in cellulose biosynthesis